MLLIVLLLTIALAASAFFTAAELAVFSLSDTRIRALVEEGFRGSDALERLRNRPRRLLALLRASNAAAAVTVAALAAALGWSLWGGWGLAGAVFVAALLVVAVGEMLPLRIAAGHTVRLALGVAPVLLLVTRWLNPILSLLVRVAQAIPVYGAGADRFAESEVEQISSLGQTEGVIEEHERQLIERAMRLDESKAWDIMTPRVDVFAWRDALKLAEVVPEFATVPYSRVPVYGESIDDITGIVYMRDAYQAILAGRDEIPLRELAREPLIVPGSISLTRLLREFQTRRIHVALVVDEYGGTDGLVTLEDILEELVGEIEDETDIAEEPIVRVSREEIVAAGDADLREINHVLKASLPQFEHRSLNGYLLEELGRVPEEGEHLDREGIRIEVLEATETQVLRARLRRLGTAGEVEAMGGRDAAPAHTAPAGGRPPRADGRGGEGGIAEGEPAGAAPDAGGEGTGADTASSAAASSEQHRSSPSSAAGEERGSGG